MQDQGFNGTGSRFNSRFEAGSPIYAKQLNDLATGIQASLPQPFVGAGPSVSFTSGGAVIGNTPDSDPVVPPTYWKPEDDNDGLTFTLRYPGTINGVIPCIDGVGLELLSTRIPTPKCEYDWSAPVDGWQSCYIYLQASPASGSDGLIWPAASISDPGYPVIYGYAEPQTDDDDFGFLLIALAQKNVESGDVFFNRFVETSIWSERHKYSQPDSAYYYYYRL
jgi:hypothetical protein